MKGYQCNYTNENSLSKDKIKTTNQWMDFKQKKPGATKLNVKYLREYKELFDDFSKILMLTYWLMTDLDLTYARCMFNSAKTQKKYIYKIIQLIKTYQIEKRFDKMFEKNVDRLRKRIAHICQILKDDIHLTPYEPFMKSLGFDPLSIEHFDLPTHEEVEEYGNKSVLSPIGELARKWNEEHPEEVEAHLKAIQPELDAYNKHREEVIAKAKAEKAEKKAQAKAEKEELKEMQKYRKAYKAEQRKIDRSFEHLYREAVYG